MYHLATTHSVTDRQTDRRQCHVNSRLHCMATAIGHLVGTTIQQLIHYNMQVICYS